MLISMVRSVFNFNEYILCYNISYNRNKLLSNPVKIFLYCIEYGIRKFSHPNFTHFYVDCHCNIMQKNMFFEKKIQFENLSGNKIAQKTI